MIPMLHVLMSWHSGPVHWPGHVRCHESRLFVPSINYHEQAVVLCDYDDCEFIGIGLYVFLHCGIDCPVVDSQLVIKLFLYLSVLLIVPFSKLKPSILVISLPYKSYRCLTA